MDVMKHDTNFTAAKGLRIEKQIVVCAGVKLCLGYVTGRMDVMKHDTNFTAAKGLLIEKQIVVCAGVK